jgi:hypothetical protein
MTPYVTSETHKLLFYWEKLETYDTEHRYSKLLSFVTLRKALTFLNLTRELSQPPIAFLFSFFSNLGYVNGNLIFIFNE